MNKALALLLLISLATVIKSEGEVPEESQYEFD